ncbi:MAG: hypothetical protein NZ958_04970 [Bacteroidia bacterium]|nr:hypothetical protein [Bacteroidia bacterium]MDW8089391.1 hypothetical protein [Bacteroidia bacterium]
MEAYWEEGRLWLKMPAYEGTHELLLLFAQRAEIKWADIDILELIERVSAILEEIDLEARVEVLFFLTQLVRWRAFALLPLPLLESPSTKPPPSSPPPSPLPQQLYLWWLERMTAQAYRLARPTSATPLRPLAEIVGLSAFRLLRAYMEVAEAYLQRHRRHLLSQWPFREEEVVQALEALFHQQPRWLFSALRARLSANRFYQMLAFLRLLHWVYEAKVHINLHSLWEAEFFWVG